jgi:hypothetical protein
MAQRGRERKKEPPGKGEGEELNGMELEWNGI